MLRGLLHFFLIGGVLLLATELVKSTTAEKPPLTVRVPATASEVGVKAAIDDAILLDQARHYGWDRNDPVVFTHLVKNMRFVDKDSRASDVELFARAIEMGLHTRDPVVRSRLLYRARASLGSVPKARMPTEQALQAHLEEHPDRFERPGRVTFHHVFLSKDRRRDALRADAERIAVTLRGSELRADDAHRLGDPLPGVRATQVATLEQALNNYGVELRGALSNEATGWQGPLQSVYGLHFIRVVEREPARVPALNAILPEVRADKLREIKAALQQERIVALRDAYDIEIERSEQ